MRIFVVLPRLDGGGMERMRLHLIAEWVSQGIDVVLVVGQNKGELVSQVPKGISILEIAPKGPAQFLKGLFSAVREYRPTHILGAADDVNCMALLVTRLFARHVRVVVSVHNTLSQQILKSNGANRWKLRAIRFAMRVLYPRAAGVVAVSEGVADDLSRQIHMDRQRISVIYNPVITDDFYKKVKEPLPSDWPRNGDPVILYVGRLTPEKRPDLLLLAFFEVLRHLPANLVVAGRGELSDRMASEIRRSDWGSRVHMMGFVPNPLPMMKAADVLVLPSDYEGLGNVLIEALACETPVVATDCPHGPAEILENGKWGRLVPRGNLNELTKGIIEALTLPGTASPQELRSRAAYFSVSTSAKQYMDLLSQ